MQYANLIELLRHRADSTPDALAYTFLIDGEIGQEISLTYRELAQRVQAIAAQLQQQVKAGDRALLLYPQGVDYVAAFFGCLYAGVIGVPVFPPRGKHTDSRIQAIAQDCQAAIVLTVDSVADGVDAHLDYAPDLRQLPWLASDKVELTLAEQWQAPEGITRDTLAFLQYTSGSTGIPKGVMVSHGNLLHNNEYMADVWGGSPDSVMVTWLPIFHDMGLIYGVLHPLFNGYPCYLMSPATFVQRPFRWLQAISHYRATHSGAPNFAYDLCAQKISAEQRRSLDLSRWEMSLNGAEPVRADTYENFYAAFKECGLKSTVISQGYGQAETTLVVAGARYTDEPSILTIRGDVLEQQHLAVPAEANDPQPQRFVGSGIAAHDARVVIANPDTMTECAEGEIGEIWLDSPSVTHGYWKRPVETEATFGAYLAKNPKQFFARTGDLGFTYKGELFVTGRIKDMMVIRGNNYYPQDIEYTVEIAHPALRENGHGAAFSIQLNGEEQLVVVQEVKREALRKLNTDEVMGAIRKAVSEEHDLQVYAIALLKTATIPRTSSGKIQRAACKVAFLADDLKTISQWQQTIAPVVSEKAATPAHSHSANAVQTWLLNTLSQAFKVPSTSIDLHEPLSRYGLDSVTALGIAGELEDWLGVPCSPTLLYDHPSVAALVRFLTDSDSTQIDTFTQQADSNESIAIVGLNCRFPQAENPQAFWQLLNSGTNAVQPAPAHRWAQDPFYGQGQNPDANTARQGGFLPEVAEFEPQFFGIAPREAEQMDPQQRLLLEVSWHALENANIPVDSLKGSRTGVFIGISTSDYTRLQVREGEALTAHTGTGNTLCIAANRLSYVLDLQGPSMAIDTACSSSLVAVHQACQSLRQHESNLALAGGVNLILSSDLSEVFNQANMLSPDGLCKTFDASANGYVRGEGCGVMVLKRLSDAQRDNDNILAVIKGSAVNQDGRSNGLTAPNSAAQQAVVRQALQQAGVQPNQIGYVEAHGTGTTLGDPIELNALKTVLMQQRSAEQACWVGSVKTNIGHLEAAAGIAGLSKLVLALQHRTIPPHLHFQQLNPLIDLANTPIQIPTSSQAWPAADDGQCYAGISSFGFGGTNAHVIVASAPEMHMPSLEPAQQSQPSTVLLPLSARDVTALQAVAANYANYVQAEADTALADIAYTASVGRSALPYRAALVAGDRAELLAQLQNLQQEGEQADCAQGQVDSQATAKIAFLCTGQGAQYVGMGRELYQTEPRFRQTLDHCASVLKPHLEQPLLAVMFAEDADNALLNETAYTQPALFALEYALADLWQSWGIQPAAVLGHSVGEYVAACLAGVFSLEDGLKLIAERARLMQSLPHDGDMVAVKADEATVLAKLAGYLDRVSVAGVNGPSNIVISGEREAIAALVKQFDADGIKTTYLTVSHAFHSPQMDPILDQFAEFAAKIALHPPKIPLISNVTGDTSADFTQPRYWADHIRQAVRFAPSMQQLQQMGCNIFLEMGPKPVLLGMGSQSIAAESALWLPSLRAEGADWSQLHDSLGQLLVQGLALDWDAIYASQAVQRVSLPAYPFQRQRYWIEGGHVVARGSAIAQGEHLHPLWAKKLHVPLLRENVFETTFAAQAPSFLADHIIFEQLVVPAASHISMLIGAAGLNFEEKACVLENVLFFQALIIPEEQPRTVQVVLTPEDKQHYSFKLISFANGLEDDRHVWAEHLSGSLLSKTTPSGLVSLSDLQQRCTEELAGHVIYDTMAKHQFALGHQFRWVETMWLGENEVLARMQRPSGLTGLEDYELHPGLIDSCFQPFFLSFPVEADQTFVPFSLEKFIYYRHPADAQLWNHVKIKKSADGQQLAIDICLFDETGLIIAEAIGLECRKANRSALLRSLEKDVNELLYDLTWQAQPASTAAVPIAETMGSWLLFADASGVAAQVAERLRAQGERCVLVSAGNDYQALGEQQYQVNPLQVDDFKRVLAEALPEGVAACRGVVFGWGLDAQGDALLNDAEWINRICAGSLHLVQALTQQQWATPPRFYCFTQGAQAVSKDEQLQPLQATLWGLGYVLSLEQPQWQPCCIDLDPTAVNLDEIWHSLWSPSLVDGVIMDRVAYRQQTRYIAKLTHHQAAASLPPLQLDSEASYIVSGGLGALGLRVAQWLAGHGARQLILLGRRAPNEAAQTVLEQLHAAGVKTAVISIDISSPQAVAELTQACAELPPVKGIIHAAGVLADALVSQQTWAEFSQVLAPKVQGSWHLHQFSLSQSLDFFVSFSSSTAVLGTTGQANYAAANAFMDSLMHARRQQGLPALTVNWGPWADGMAANLGEREQARLQSIGLSRISPAQGLSVLERVLVQDLTQVAVLPITWDKFLAQFASTPALLSEFVEQVSSDTSAKQSRLLQQLASTAPAQQWDALFKHVRSQLGKVAKLRDVSQVQARQRFFDLGLDSLMAVELKNALQSSVQQNLRATLIFDYPTLEALVNHLFYDVLGLSAGNSEVNTDDNAVDQWAQLDALSEAELGALLDQKLAELDF